MRRRSRRAAFVLAAASVTAAILLAVQAAPARSAATTSVTGLVGPAMLVPNEGFFLSLGLDRSGAAIPATITFKNAEDMQVIATKEVTIEAGHYVTTPLRVLGNNHILMDGADTGFVTVLDNIRVEVTAHLRKKGPRIQGSLQTLNASGFTTAALPVSIGL